MVRDCVDVMLRAATCASRIAIVLAAAALLALHASGTRAQALPESADFATLARACAPHIDATTLAALVRVESGFNPYAIGVVGAHLRSQPHSYAQALATARALAARGYDFSVGLGQVNVRNLARVGESLETIFEPCRNLRAASTILQQCFARSSARAEDAQHALRDALSCYYSGNFWTGYRQGYVTKILASAYTNWRIAHAQRARADGPDRAGAIAAHGDPTTAGRAVQAAAVHAPARFVPAHQASSALAGTNACDSGSSRLQVTVRCAGHSGRWCTRCLDTSESVQRTGLTAER